jgi:predicted nucleotidyltransferase
MEPKAVAALRILSRVLSLEGRRFVLIGAIVPQIVIDFRKDYGSRETRDVDAVAEVTSWEDFDRIREHLLESGFREGSVAHEFWFDEVRIDLIPFGPGLIHDNKVSWPYGDSVMTACGFDEALGCAREELIAQDFKLPVVTIPGLVLTKIVAYMDRPQERARDLIDILYCFEHYEETAGQSRRFDHAGTMIDDKEVAYEDAGAFLLGIEVKALAKPESLEIVLRFLASIRDEFAPAISQILTEEKRLVDTDDRRSVLYRLFRVFRAGIERQAGV